MNIKKIEDLLNEAKSHANDIEMDVKGHEEQFQMLEDAFDDIKKELVTKEKWVVSQEVYDEFQELKQDEFIETVYDAFSAVINRVDKNSMVKYTYLNFLLIVDSDDNIEFAKAWAGEIEVEVEKPKRYLLFQVNRYTDEKQYVTRFSTELIQFYEDKRFATRFTAEEYPHYKNDFMQVEEVDE